MTFIRADQLSITYHGQPAIGPFSFELKRGHKMALTGSSGSGKSSIINALLGFVPFNGTFEIDGQLVNGHNINKIRQTTAWIPQDFFLPIDYLSEVPELLFRFEKNKKHAPDKLTLGKQLARFGLRDALLEKAGNESSGGEKQRILIACCLLMHKPLLLLDEPTSALDDETAEKVMKDVLDNPSLTVIAATHHHQWKARSDVVIDLNNT